MTDINGVPIHEALKTNGYVIVDNLIPDEMMSRLKEATERVVEKARKGEWHYVRTVGKQFPPWNEEDNVDVWGVQHLMHPDLKESVFMEWYGSEGLLNAVQQLNECTHDELQFELFNLLINPRDSDFSLTYHRDAIPAETPEDKEREMLKIPHYGTQWNTALYEDDCLFVVPASHRRVRTPEERDISLNNPKGDMPGQLRVNLKPGQTVFYDNNILHRAAYFKDKKRHTLHASMGTTNGGHHRGATIFQHGLGWLNSDEFKATLIDSLKVPYNNTVLMAQRAGIDSDMKTKPLH
ncbi:hypothetical protein BC940DRAFT_337394 [Gongronella butleri]|nr:hypothetical protein BC940DRAFT_337394 [Gongronella butleri]